MRRIFMALGLSAAAGAPAAGQPVPPNLKVAFIGDQGLGSDARAVLAMCVSEGADAIVHLGDFDYSDDPAAWEDQMNAVLPACFPYFAVAGNHDENEFAGYQDVIEARMNCAGVPWHGSAGDQFAFTYQGVYFVLTTPGLLGGGDADYVADRLASPESQAAAWRVSGWHVLMRNLQIGGKGDESGWPVYENSRLGGAIVATAHEHSYERTNLLSDMSDQVVEGDELVISEGKTFAFVSGIGGESIRNQERCFPTSPPYGCNGTWATIYAEEQGANHGALFLEFNSEGDPCRAYGYFKDISGNVPDQFFVQSTCGPCAGGSGPPDPGPSETSARIFWRRPLTGANELWLLDGTQVLAGSGPLPGKSGRWVLAGTGDFDANGTSDMLWRHKTTGETTIWLMDGAEHLSSGALPVLSPQWKVAGTEDFDGDGRSDILWRKSLGVQSMIWFMDGTMRRPESGALPDMLASWSVAATGDFDGDGFGDILWRKQAAGLNRAWFMQGTSLVPEPADLIARTAVWKVAGAADFDGDGFTDILWRRPAVGQNAVWFMQGATARAESGMLPVMSATWSVAGTADFDADGFADILWRKQAMGSNLIWFMQGTSLAPDAQSIEPKHRAWIALLGD
jgi:predicted phosphodiesterase